RALPPRPVCPSTFSPRSRGRLFPTVPRPIMPTLICCLIFTVVASAAGEPLPPWPLLIFGIAEAGRNAGLNDGKVEWLQDVVKRADLHRLACDLTIRKCSQHDHVGMRGAAHDLFQSFHSSHPGHADL